MQNQQLIDYIKTSLAQGQAADQIHAGLVSAGWQEGDISAAFQAASSSAPQNVPQDIQPDVSLENENTSRKKDKIVMGITWVLVVLAIGALAWTWWYISSKKDAPAPKVPIVNSQTQDNVSDSTTANTGGNTVKGAQSFTTEQLANLKKDLTAVYLKYKGKDTNIEPTKSAFAKDMDDVFLKDLGVSDATGVNSGVFLNPDIAQITKSIDDQYGGSSGPTSTTTTTKTSTTQASNSGAIEISNLNYTTISVAKLADYKDKPLTIQVALNGNTIKCMTYDIIHYDASGKVTDDSKSSYPDCSSGIVKNGVYTDKYHFSNAPYSSSSFVGYGSSDHIVEEFYATDTNGKESNRLRLTFTK